MDTPTRTALLAGAVVAIGAALAFALAPTTWLERLLALSEADAAAFLLRRYGASATAALAVVAGAAAFGARAPRVALLGLGTWFGVQGVVAAWGLLVGVAGGFAWVALVGDPVLAAWSFLLARRHRRPPEASARESPPHALDTTPMAQRWLRRDRMSVRRRTGAHVTGLEAIGDRVDGAVGWGRTPPAA